jgi:hypothetical protein
MLVPSPRGRADGDWRSSGPAAAANPELQRTGATYALFQRNYAATIESSQKI